MNEGKPKEHPSAEERHESRVEDPLLAHELALSTKTLRDSAAELRNKAKLATREIVKGVAIPSDRIKEAYRDKAERIEEVADSLERDATATITLMEQEPDKKKRLMLSYELVKTHVLSRLYTFFTRADDLVTKDIWTPEDERALREYYRRQTEEERGRQERTRWSVPPPEHPFLKLLGFYEEDKK